MQYNSFSFCLSALVLLCYIVLIAPTLASNSNGGVGGSNMDNIKSELRDGQTLNGGSGGGNTPNGAGAVGSTGNFFGSNGRRNLRSIYGFGGPKMLQISRSKIPIELDLLVENDDGDRSKRFDDYGHMRFGKRGGEEQFDDYGHMRFGRSM